MVCRVFLNVFRIFTFTVTGVGLISELLLAIMVGTKHYPIAIGIVKGGGGILSTGTSLAVGALAAKDATFVTTGILFDALVFGMFVLAVGIFMLDRNDNGRLTKVTASPMDGATWESFQPHPKRAVDDDEQRPIAGGDSGDDADDDDDFETGSHTRR